MKILILGGHGFVGRNVVEVFKDSNHEIFPFSRKNGLDLTDYVNTTECFQKINPDIIINCAAKVGSLNYVTQEAAEVFDINMRMLLNTYKVAQEIIPGVVIINPVANCAFPGGSEIYKEDSLWNGQVHHSVLSYGSTRRMMLVLSECYEMQYGLRSINFFVPNMYGPYDSTDPNKAHALNALISKLVKIKRQNKKEIEVWGSGVAIREWLFAKDFARILLETISKINYNENDFKQPLNIAQNYGLSVKELLNIIIEEVGFSGKINWNRDMPDGAPRKVMDDTQFRKVFPDFEFTELVKGIRETIKYYESIYPY
jgi:GDP-L-fucose synthase